jgi:hypothetical protein
VASREWKRLHDLGLLMEKEKVLMVLASVAESVRTHVKDRPTLQATQNDIDRVLWLSARKRDPPPELKSASKMDPPQPHPFQ